MWCLFAGGGIRDSWNNLMEETSDAGGMCISILASYRCETMCHGAMLDYQQGKEDPRAPDPQGPVNPMFTVCQPDYDHVINCKLVYMHGFCTTK